MLRSWITRRVDAEERRAGVPLEYVRHILRVSLPAFMRYAAFIPMSRYRRRLPADAFHVARLVATRRQDCGSCVQIVVNLARRDGLGSTTIADVLAARVDALPSELQDVYRFAEAVVDATYDEGPLRERLRSRYGEEALVELALAIASAQVFPVAKRALKYAISCSRVEIRV